MTIEGYEGSDRILLSYDVSGNARSVAARVCHIVFGRRRVDSDGHVREQNGFIHRPGVVWIGQSVLAMPPRDAEELRLRLESLGVRVATARVAMGREVLEAFGRPRVDDRSTRQPLTEHRPPNVRPVDKPVYPGRPARESSRDSVLVSNLDRDPPCDYRPRSRLD